MTSINFRTRVFLTINLLIILLSLLFTLTFIVRNRNLRERELINRGTTYVSNLCYFYRGKLTEVHAGSAAWNFPNTILNQSNEVQLIGLYHPKTGQALNKPWTKDNFSGQSYTFLETARNEIRVKGKNLVHRGDQVRKLDHSDVLLIEIYAPIFKKNELGDLLQKMAFSESYQDRWQEKGNRNEIPDNLEGIALVVVSTEQIDEMFQKDVNTTLGLVLVCMIIAFITSFYFSRKILQPIKNLIRSMQKLGRNQQWELIEIKRNDEIGQLGMAFNQMAQEIRLKTEELEKAYAEIQQFNKMLEEKVKERTRKLEETHVQLVHKEKMASLGKMVAGVAHEINNPLSCMYANLYNTENIFKDLFTLIDAFERGDHQVLLQTKEDLSIDELKSSFRIILDNSLEGVKRIIEIVKNLRTFSRLDEAQIKVIDIHEGMDITLNLLNHKLKGGPTVIKNYGPIPQLRCLASQLNQVFMNILSNAIDACESLKDKGQLRITTWAANETMSDQALDFLQESQPGRLLKQSGNRANEPEPVVKIRIEDNGCGIAPEYLPKIFDPFFTTKEVGKGTGLGLAISYSIIEKHRGNILVESTIGQGTAFTVTIPINFILENT